MTSKDLTELLAQTIRQIQYDKIDLKKAEALVRTSNSIIKLQCAKIAHEKLPNFIPFFKD